MGYGVKAQESVSAGAGIYAVDTARWFLGEDFTEVFAYGNRKNLPSRNVDDHDVALFRTASGAIARVQCSKAARRPYKEITKSVWGTQRARSNLRGICLRPRTVRGFTDVWWRTAPDPSLIPGLTRCVRLKCRRFQYQSGSPGRWSGRWGMAVWSSSVGWT